MQSLSKHVKRFDSLSENRADLTVQTTLSQNDSSIIIESHIIRFIFVNDTLIGAKMIDHIISVFLRRTETLAGIQSLSPRRSNCDDDQKLRKTATTKLRGHVLNQFSN